MFIKIKKFCKTTKLANAFNQQNSSGINVRDHDLVLKNNKNMYIFA